MFPTLIEIGPIPVHAYGFMMAVAFVTGMYLLRRQAAQEGLNPDIIGDGTFWTLIIGLLGSRVAHIVMFPDHYSWSDPRGWIAIWEGGLVFQGALPPAAAFVIYWGWKHNLRFLFLFDLAAPVVALGHGIGRVGCFMNGCCYGGATNSFLGVQFPRVPADESVSATGSPAYIDHLRRGLIEHGDHASLPIHPTQLYAFVGLVTISLTLMYLRKHWRPFDGAIASVYFMMYGTFRFVLEFVRADHNPTHLGAFTDQQVISIALILIGVSLFLFLRGRNVPPTSVEAATS